MSHSVVFHRLWRLGGNLGAAPTLTEKSPRAVKKAAELTGRLEGDPDRGCLWIGGLPKAAAGGGPISVDWPEGFTVAREPLRLVGPTGEVVARPGDFLSLGGGSAASGHQVDCKMGDHVFIVHDIERVMRPALNPRPPLPNSLFARNMRDRPATFRNLDLGGPLVKARQPAPGLLECS
ncbi:MAG: hypothetical protein M3O70_17550 [Actinomycetota bacterium]|nr:hypothetical protein [Actinomycetota bacterium]